MPSRYFQREINELIELVKRTEVTEIASTDFFDIEIRSRSVIVELSADITGRTALFRSSGHGRFCAIGLPTSVS
jgi:hypothetical protein